MNSIALPTHLSVQVLAVLKTVLTSLGSNKQELSKSALNFLVSLIVSGAADLALGTAKAWAATADPSLVRHFIQLVSLVT